MRTQIFFNIFAVLCFQLKKVRVTLIRQLGWATRAQCSRDNGQLGMDGGNVKLATHEPNDTITGHSMLLDSVKSELFKWTIDKT